MTERRNGEIRTLSPGREMLFARAETELHYQAQVYRLGERFEGLAPELAQITMLDVTQVPGCHYGLKNIFVPLIKYLEAEKRVTPANSKLIEASTGNGWVAFSEAAQLLGYEHAVIMPDGLPETRYQHPAGRNVEIIKTPKEKYAEGMPEELEQLTKLSFNRERIQNGARKYVSPNHAAGDEIKTNITVKAMSELGQQLLANIGEQDEPIRVVVSMGNGASLCALGEYVKNHTNGAKVVATESLPYGGGFDRFARQHNLSSYKELFGIDPGDPRLMAHFSAFGTNAPIGIDMPLQNRAFDRNLIDKYELFTDNEALQAYNELPEHMENGAKIPNTDALPRVLYETFGNSTLGNIAVAAKFTGRGERVAAMAYDDRQNY